MKPPGAAGVHVAMHSISTCFPIRLRPWLLLALALLTATLGACSATRLAYSQLDWLIPRQLGDYVTLDSTQSDWLDARLQDHLAWHCRTQLPAYAEWLGTLRAELNGAPPDSERLQDHVRQLETFIDALLGEIAPTAAELAVRLDERQRDELFARLDRRLNKDRAKYLDRPPDQRRSERAERLEDRLRYWVGELTPEQTARIRQWSAALPDQNTASWLENRQRLQAAARDSLADPDERSAQLRLARLLEAPTVARTPAYQRQFEQSRDQAIALTADLLRLATDRQRSQLDRRLNGFATDFQKVRCTKEAVAVLRPESG